MRAPSSKCKAPDHFFKLIPPGLNSQLSIPTSFKKYMKSTRNNTTAILKKGRRKWPVKIIASEFGEGWEDFVRENGVQEFDIVVFKHEGNMVFDTMVFDASLCEKAYPTNQVTESSSGKYKIDNINEPKKRLKRKDTNPDHNHHPAYFIGNLKSARWKYALYLPIKFTRANGLTAGEMILRNGQTQRSWTVDLSICSLGSARIGRGWHDFYISNGLKEGDPFKLELVRTGMKPEAIFYDLSTMETESLKNRHPYFVTTLKKYGIQHKMYLPKKFSVETELHDGEMILKCAENEGSWTVHLRNYMDKFFYIGRGLHEFCVANGLEKGDSLKFVLIQNAEKPVAIISRLPKVDSPATPIHTAQGPLLNPYFKSTATVHSISNNYVIVPVRFARSNGLFKRSCEMVLRDEKQRIWAARLCCPGHHRVYIRGIRRDMWDANGLKKGDDFLLELVDNGKKPQMTLHKYVDSGASTRCSNEEEQE